MGTIAILYVDDILVASPKAEGIHLITSALDDAKVKTKLTGLISNDTGEAGILTFLGRSIRRNKLVTMRVPPEYLETVFHEFDVTSYMSFLLQGSRFSKPTRIMSGLPNSQQTCDFLQMTNQIIRQSYLVRINIKEFLR